MDYMRAPMSLAITFLSAAACIAFATEWVRSYRARDVITFAGSRRTACWIESVRGGIQFVDESNPPSSLATPGWSVSDPADPLPRHTYVGFGIARSTFPVVTDEGIRQIGLTAMVVPCYSLCLVALVPIVVVLRRVKRRKTPLQRFPVVTLPSQKPRDLRDNEQRS
jgi:hypothetical protein